MRDKRTFVDLDIVSRDAGEKNDCTVKAVAFAANVPYQEAHKLLAAAGRVPGRGVRRHVYMGLLNDLGFKLTPMFAPMMAAAMMSLRERFPDNQEVESSDWVGYAKTPITLERVLPHRGVFLVHTARHVFVAKNGKVLDWTAGGRHRITSIHRVTRV